MYDYQKQFAFLTKIHIQDSSVYAIFSKLPISEQVTTGQSVTLPYLPSFFYAAFETSDESQDVTVSYYNSEPADLEDNIHFMDGFNRKVIKSLENSKRK